MLKTAEYARRGHVDRMADEMVDAILDEAIRQDKNARVALDCFGCHGVIMIGGEMSTTADIDIPKIVKGVYREIGYKDNVGVVVNIVEQSPEIRDLANTGAGDSGIMVGYATRETPEMLPLEVVICKKVCDLLDTLPYLMPDGKVQATIDGTELKTLVVSVQGKTDYDSTIPLNVKLEDSLLYYFPCEDLRLTIFQKGGFDADSGLTGRKNVLWYGPQVPTGGGAFAGKDPTKVDRSGAYYARYVALKYLEDNPEAKEALVKIAFAIGKDTELMLTLNDIDYYQAKGIKRALDLKVAEMIDFLDLRKPTYKQASILGHFGDKSLKWEI